MSHSSPFLFPASLDIRFLSIIILVCWTFGCPRRSCHVSASVLLPSSSRRLAATFGCFVWMAHRPRSDCNCILTPCFSM